MSEFEKWFDDKYPEQSKTEMLRMSKHELREHKRQAAERAWNAVINKAMNKVDYYDLIEELKTDE